MKKLMYFEILMSLSKVKEWSKGKISCDDGEVMWFNHDRENICCYFEAVWAIKNGFEELPE